MRLLLLSIFALALSMTAASAKGFYVTSESGLNWSDSKLGDDADDTVSPNTGYMAGLAIGTHLGVLPDLRTELEVSFRSNDLPSKWSTSRDQTTAFMLNGVYSFPQYSLYGVHPFVMAGSGIADRTVHGQWKSYSDTGLAYQAGGGLEATVFNGIDASLSYRYFHGPNVSHGEDHSGGDNSAFVFGLTANFD